MQFMTISLPLQQLQVRQLSACNYAVGQPFGLPRFRPYLVLEWESLPTQAQPGAAATISATMVNAKSKALCIGGGLASHLLRSSPFMQNVERFSYTPCWSIDAHAMIMPCCYVHRHSCCLHGPDLSCCSVKPESHPELIQTWCGRHAMAHGSRDWGLVQ